MSAPWLHAIATPATFLASLPASLPILGLLGTIAIAIGAVMKPSPHTIGLAQVALWILSLAALAPMAAMARPLPWVAGGLLIAAWFRDDRTGSASASAAVRSPWMLGALPVLWLVLARIRPFGAGLLPDEALDLLALSLSDRPLLADGLAILLPLAIAPLIAGGRVFDVRRSALGAGAALALVASFGSDQAWLSAAVLGGVIGGWAPRPSRSPSLLLALLVICAAASMRLALTERWRCADAAVEAAVTQLRAGSDVRSLGLSAGNLGYLALIVEDGAALQRMTVTGALGESVPLDPPGGFLVSPLAPGAPVIRVVPDPTGAQIEWWDIPRLTPVGSVRAEVGCRIGRALDDGERVLGSCGDRTFAITKDGLVGELPLRGAPVESLNGGLLVLREGPLARARVVGDGSEVAASWLGPYAADLAASPGRFLVAHGPSGHLGLRAAPPPIPSYYTPPQAPAQRVTDSLRHRADSVRVGVWPGTVRYSPKRRGAYVTSPVDASVTLVDVEVSWQQAAVSVGAPPRQVVLETGSGSLYVANRCGVFAVRIPRPDPWE